MTDNACGSCTACCRVYSISEIGKPAGQWCEHCAVGKGCKIYEKRPWKCVEFECLWLHSQHGGFGNPMPDEMRPDRCKVVFSPLDDTFIALCMPGSPDAWRKGAGRKVVDWLVGNGYRVLAGLPGTRTRTLIDPNLLFRAALLVAPRGPTTKSMKERIPEGIFAESDRGSSDRRASVCRAIRLSTCIR